VNLLTRVDSTHGNAKDSATFAVGDRVTSWLGASYTYDADGNRATRTVGSTVTTYTWDASGRLLQVKTGTDSVTYAYNALGDLARRSTRGQVDRWFVWEEGQLLEELDSTAQHRVNAFAYLPGTDQPLARITGDAASTIEFVQQDGRGDVIGLTNGASVTQHVLYGPWGNLEAFSGDSLPQTRLGWKGLVWEGGTAQLYYVRSRWYDPQSGSFLSEDPLGLSGGRNTYAYADNDPVNGWDPSGKSMVEICYRIDWYLNGVYWYSEDVCGAAGDGDGRGGGGGTSNSHNKAQSPKKGIKATMCSLLPQGREVSVEGSLGGVGGLTTSFQEVTNYNTGEVSDFATWGIHAGWNAVASASVSTGFILMPNGQFKNADFSGAFNNVSASAPEGFGGSVSWASNGVKVASASFGVNALPTPTLNYTRTWTSNPRAAGSIWTNFDAQNPMEFADLTLYGLRQLCK
jgi:RHS repeat-associated protein